MKKLLLTLYVCSFMTVLAYAAPAAERLANGYTFQKQIIITHKPSQTSHTCQAFRIHQNWFATAAHCVEICERANSCEIKIILAQGSISAFTLADRKDVFIPKKYRTVDAKGRSKTHTNWDVALIRYRPEEYLYEYAEGGAARADEFRQELKAASELRVQWNGAVNPKIPVLHTYGGEELMRLRENIVVPRWENGEMQYFDNPQNVLYFGERQAMWGSDGFGVDHGNSGGAVVLNDGGIVGIATAKADNHLPAEVRATFPEFGRAHDFFLFNGFAPKTTLGFIEKTMAKYGDRPLTQKLKQIKPMEDPVLSIPVP